MFLWTVRMQFSQSRRKNFLTECWWISAQCPKMIADFFRETFFHMLLWICGLQFWLHCRNVNDKKSIFFDQRPKLTKKLQRKSSPWMVPLDMKNTVLTTLLRRFWTKNRKCSAQCPKRTEKMKFIQESFSLRSVPLGAQNAVLTTP